MSLATSPSTSSSSCGGPASSYGLIIEEAAHSTATAASIVTPAAVVGATAVSTDGAGWEEIWARRAAFNAEHGRFRVPKIQPADQELATIMSQDPTAG